MKKIFLFSVLILFASQADAYILKKKEKKEKGTIQRVIVKCQKMDNSPSKEIVITERVKKVKKWSAWEVKGQGGKFKKWEKAVEERCNELNLK